MHKFRTGAHQIRPIMKVEVIRETEKCVYVEGFAKQAFRENKRGDYRNYFDEWAEAQQFLVNSAQARVKGAQEQLKAYEARLAEVKSLKPEDAA